MSLLEDHLWLGNRMLCVGSFSSSIVFMHIYEDLLDYCINLNKDHMCQLVISVICLSSRVKIVTDDKDFDAGNR